MAKKKSEKFKMKFAPDEDKSLGDIYKEKAMLATKESLETTVDNVSYRDLLKLSSDYTQKLETDIEYSMDVDPLNLYNLTPTEKQFVKYWIDFMDIKLICVHMNISPEEALEMYHMYGVQTEIRRIRTSMYLRQFATRMMSVDEIGGYLTALMMDQVPTKDMLSSREKIQVSKLLMDLNKLKKESFENPSIITYADFEENLKDLSTKSIRQLIDNSMNMEEYEQKSQTIDAMNKDGLMTVEDQQYLKTLSQKELLEMQNQMNKDEGWK